MEYNGAGYICAELGTMSAAVAGRLLQNVVRKNLMEAKIGELIVRPSYENHDGERPVLNFVALSRTPVRDTVVNTKNGPKLLPQYYWDRHQIVLEDVDLPAIIAWRCGSYQYFPPEVLDFLEPTEENE